MKKRDLKQVDDSLLESEGTDSVNEESSAGAFIQKNSKIIIAVSAVVILLIVIGFYLRNKSINDSQRASVLLTRVMEYYESADYEKALNGDPERTYLGEQVKGLKYIADEFSGTDQGKIAALYAGNALFNIDKAKESQKYFELASKSSAEMIKMGGIAGIASIYENEGKYKEAAKEYVEASQISSVDNIKVRYLYFAGLCFEKSNDNKHAEQYFREVIKLNEFGEFSSLAKSGLIRIGTIIE